MRPVQLWPWQPKIKIAIDEITDNVEYLSEVVVEASVKPQQMHDNSFEELQSS